MKARRWSHIASPTRVHVGRLDGDRFEYLVFVLLGETMEVRAAVRLPISTVRLLTLGSGVDSTVARLLGSPDAWTSPIRSAR